MEAVCFPRKQVPSNKPKFIKIVLAWAGKTYLGDTHQFFTSRMW